MWYRNYIRQYVCLFVSLSVCHTGECLKTAQYIVKLSSPHVNPSFIFLQIKHTGRGVALLPVITKSGVRKIVDIQVSFIF